MSPKLLKKKADEEEPSNFGLACVFKYEELEKATNSFNTELGVGGFGRVYLGTLPDGRKVAVKVLFDDPKRVEQFFNEVTVLPRLRHKNLITLYGCTNPFISQKFLLVYDYVPNGTVAEHLHDRRSDLTLAVRIQIAVETAAALKYLHTLEPPIIHRDVKTSNILLDNALHAKVADLGICRHLPWDTTHVSTLPQGTLGYRDPDYDSTFLLTDKSDVYSLGVVLMELISGQQAVDVKRDPIYLDNLALKKILNKKLKDFVDPKLGYQSNRDVKRVIDSVAKLACKCLHPKGRMRPTMVQVLTVLKEIQNQMPQIGQIVVDVMPFGPQRDLGYGNHNNERHKILKDIQKETQQIGQNEVDAISFSRQQDLVDGSLNKEIHKNLKGLQNETQQTGLREVSDTSLSPQQEFGDGNLNNERHEIMKAIQVGLNKVDVISSDPQRALSDGSLALNIGMEVVLTDLGGSEGDGNEHKKPAGDQKPKPPQTSTVVLKIELHCEGCTKKIVKIIRKVKGVERVTVKDGDLVTVTGIMDMKTFPTLLQEKLKKGVEVVPQNKDNSTGKGEKKKMDGGGGGEEGKKNEGGGSVQEEEKKNECGGGGGADKKEDGISGREERKTEDSGGGGADKKEGDCDGGEENKKEGGDGGGMDKKEDGIGGGEERKKEGGGGGGTEKREGNIGGVEEKKKEGGSGEIEEKENEGSSGGGMDKKASYDGGGEEKKKEDGTDKKKEGGVEKEEGKVATKTMNKMYYHMPHYDLYQIETVHAPQMFSDENPNACSIM